MTTISAVMRRSYTPTMFADRTDIAHVRTFDSLTKVTTLTFDGDLDEATAEAIWARMESANEGDQTKRATLRADRDALAPADPLRRLYDYMLGD